MKITPQWVATFETNVQTLIQDAWARSASNSCWDKFMDVRQSQTGRELLFYLLETAKITSEDQGGNKRFDDIAATFFEIVNQNAGAGLRLTKNEIEDNQMSGASLRGMPALDYASNWARQMGGNASYWPQEKMFELLLAGEGTTVGKAYDGLSFFSNAHLTNPLLASGPTYANLFTGAAASTPSTDPLDASYPGACPIDAANASTLDTAFTNISKAIAYIGLLKQPNGKPRNLKVKYALGGPLLSKRLFEIFDTKYYGTGSGSTENVLSRMGIEPVIANEITSATEYYLACDIIEGEGGGLIFQDRSPYVLTSYSLDTLAELQRRKEFEWSFDGRNAAAYGHPYLMFKVKAT